MNWFKDSPHVRTLDTIDGEPMEFEWNIFTGFTKLQLTNKVHEFMTKMGDPSQFKGRIIFMSMFNDMMWGSEDNERECNANATLVSFFVKRFPAGRWSFLGPGSAKKWYSTFLDRPQRERDRVAESMMIRFGESGHPVFRAKSPLSRGTLRSNGRGKLSTHFCADGWTIETVFLTIISVNQLSIYGAVSELCEEYKSCHVVRARRFVLVGQIWPIVCACNCVDENTYTFDRWSCTRRLVAKVPRTGGKALTINFVLMQDSWQQLESDSTSLQRTPNYSHNLQNQWYVVSTLCQEMKSHLTRKVVFEGTPKLGPC